MACNAGGWPCNDQEVYREVSRYVSFEAGLPEVTTLLLHEPGKACLQAVAYFNKIKSGLQ
jgi:hypothetical protein